MTTRAKIFQRGNPAAFWPIRCNETFFLQGTIVLFVRLGQQESGLQGPKYAQNSDDIP